MNRESNISIDKKALKAQMDAIEAKIKESDKEIAAALKEVESRGISKEKIEERRLEKQSKEENTQGKIDQVQKKQERENIEQEKILEVREDIISKDEEREREEYFEWKLKMTGLTEDDFDEIPAWKTFSPAEKLLAVDQISQVMLSKVKKLGEEKFKQQNKLTKNPLSWAKTIGRNMTKAVWISKAEKEVVDGIQRGKVKPDQETLKGIVQRTAELNFEVTVKNGEPQIVFEKANRNMGEEEKHIIEEYNDAANAFARMPEDWANKKSAMSKDKKFFKNESAHHNEYLQTKERYEQAKDMMLEIKAQQYWQKGERNPDAKAMLDINEQRKNIWLTQQATTNPDAYEELKRIKGELSVGRLANNETGWRAAYIAGGMTARHVFDFAPMASGVIGGIRSWANANKKINKAFSEGRTEETFLERKEAGKKGVYDSKNAGLMNKAGKLISGFEVNTKRVAGFVDADSQIQRLENLMGKLDQATSDTDRAEILSAIQTRVGYIEAKHEEGLLNYGSKDQLAQKYNLLEIMSRAAVSASEANLSPEIVALLEQENSARERKNIYGETIKNGLLVRIMSKNEKILEKRQRNFKIGETARGVLVATGFSVLGMKIKEWWVSGTPEAPKVPSTVPEHGPVVPVKPEPVVDPKPVDPIPEKPTTPGGKDKIIDIPAKKDDEIIDIPAPKPAVKPVIETIDPRMQPIRPHEGIWDTGGEKAISPTRGIYNESAGSAGSQQAEDIIDIPAKAAAATAPFVRSDGIDIQSLDNPLNIQSPDDQIIDIPAKAGATAQGFKDAPFIRSDGVDVQSLDNPLNIQNPDNQIIDIPAKAGTPNANTIAGARDNLGTNTPSGPRVAPGTNVGTPNRDALQDAAGRPRITPGADMRSVQEQGGWTRPVSLTNEQAYEDAYRANEIQTGRVIRNPDGTYSMNKNYAGTNPQGIFAGAPKANIEGNPHHTLESVRDVRRTFGRSNVFIEKPDQETINGVEYQEYNRTADQMFKENKVKFPTYNEYEKEYELQQLFGEAKKEVAFIEAEQKNIEVTKMKYFRVHKDLKEGWAVASKMKANDFFEFKNPTFVDGKALSTKDVEQLIKSGIIREEVITSADGQEFRQYSFKNQAELNRLFREYRKYVEYETKILNPTASKATIEELAELNSKPFEKETIEHYVARITKDVHQTSNGTYYAIRKGSDFRPRTKISIFGTEQPSVPGGSYPSGGSISPTQGVYQSTSGYGGSYGANGLVSRSGQSLGQGMVNWLTGR